MKILHVIYSVDPRYGGPLEAALAMSLIWRRRGHESHILCLDSPNAPYVKASPVPTFALGAEGRFYETFRKVLPWLRYGYTSAFAPWLRAHGGDYDAVIVNGLWNYTSLGAWMALHRSATPYFLFTHGMLDPWFNKAFPLKALVKAAFWKLFEHRVARDARVVLFTSEEERELAARSFSPYQAREGVVGLGARAPEGDPVAQVSAFTALLPTLQNRKFILFLSRIHEKKGVDLLIEAFARLSVKLRDFDLVIAGPDQTGLKAGLQKRAAELGLADRMHWPGMLTGDVKWGAFRCAEFFALPSHQENFGVVVAESLALGTPVLITNKVNIWREVEADGGGFVVNDDIDGVAAGLERMCSLSPEQRERMSQKGSASFCKRFDLEINALDLLAFIDRNRSAPFQAAKAANRFRAKWLKVRAKKTRFRALSRSAACAHDPVRNTFTQPAHDRINPMTFSVDIWHNVLWAKYKGAIFTALHRELMARGVKARFFQIAETDPLHSVLAPIDLGYHDYPFELIEKGPYPKRSMRLVAKLFFKTLNSPADVVVIAGYHAPEYICQLLAARICGKRTLVFCDSTYLDHPRGGLREWTKGALFRFFDGVLCYGMRSADYARHYNVDEGKLYTGCQAAALPLDYSVEGALRIRSRLKPADREIILYVGRLAAEKDIPTLIRAFDTWARVNENCFLRLVGDGPQSKELHDLAATCASAERIAFLGGKSGDALYEEYAGASCLVLPSISEPWGLVVNEALSFGCPVVVSENCGCAPELVIEGKTGFRFPTSDAEALGKALGRVLGPEFKNPDVSTRCIEHMTLFSPDRAAHKIALALEDVMGRGRGVSSLQKALSKTLKGRVR